jgi:hypothetical protein
MRQIELPHWTIYFLVLSALGLGRFFGFLSPMTQSFLCARGSHVGVFSMSSHRADGEQFSDVFQNALGRFSQRSTAPMNANRQVGA